MGHGDNNFIGMSVSTIFDELIDADHAVRMLPIPSLRDLARCDNIGDVFQRALIHRDRRRVYQGKRHKVSRTIRVLVGTMMWYAISQRSQSCNSIENDM